MGERGVGKLCGGVAFVSGGVTDPELAGWDIFGDDRTGGNHGIFADGDSTQDGGIGADGGTTADACFLELIGVLLGAREFIIGECDIGTDEDIIFDGDSVPELDAAFDGDVISQGDIIFNKALGIDIAVGADGGTWKDDAELPDPGCRPDRGGLNICQWVNKCL